jgi:broad specificity phosphatase PhoE
MDPRSATATVVLVRHAQSEWNASGRWQGHADPPLSPEGEAQARALAERMRGQAASLLVSSDLRRAVQTAAPLAEVLGLEHRVDAALRELDVGRWSGLVRDEIEALDAAALARFESGDPAFRPGDGESRAALRRRARRAIRHWIAEQPAGRIVVVTHLGFIRALLPGEDPDNAQLVEVTAHDALTRRKRHDARVAVSHRSL